MGVGVFVKGAPSNSQTLENTPLPLFFPRTETMVRVKPLASAALLSLATIEVVIANSQESQQHLRDPSGFLDTCNLIQTSVSNNSVVYYPRESSINVYC